ncbi:transposase [Streptosporangium sp. NPDC049248]|uniref:transposase n=1 Tax=Streptosporangium sp. NPDC049248 TaxID=3155651 RepID=UPI00343F3A71
MTLFEPEQNGGSSPFPAEPLRDLRPVVVRRLLELESQGSLTGKHVELVASCCGVTDRTVWRWLEAARVSCGGEQAGRRRFEVTKEVRSLLAFWNGNAAAVRRELVEMEQQGGSPAPSMSTLHRAVRRDLSAGHRATLRKGERAARSYNVFLRRSKKDNEELYRNVVWEADHKDSHVEVDIDGRLYKAWVTWFIDVATDVICGVAVTAGTPSRDAVLAALRSAILRTEPYSPFGGLPGFIRIDRGNDFLSNAVQAALGRFAIAVGDLPAYHPYLKGTVEAINGAAEEMLFVSLPRYTRRPKLINNKVIDPDQPPLTFEAFVNQLLDWVHKWNNDHVLSTTGKTPAEGWYDDPTPLSDVPAEELRMFTMEDDGRARKITTKGVQWKKKFYVADWMTGHAGLKVRLRWIPHHDHEVEVFEDRTGRYLGSAYLSDQATSDQIAAMHRARAKVTRQGRTDLRAAEKLRRMRFAAVTTAHPPQILGTVTALEAQVERERFDEVDLTRLAIFDPPSPAPLPPGWVLPKPPSAVTEHQPIEGTQE